MYRKKLNAFTIPELLVAMLVSAIVLIAVLYGFQLVGGLLITSQKRSVASTNGAILCSALSTDVARADSILHHGDTLLVYSDSLRVRYYTDSSRIIRDQPPRLDTLGTSVAITNVTVHPQVDRFVTAITLAISINGRPSTYTFEKQYDSALLFEAHTSTIEKKWESKYRK